MPTQRGTLGPSESARSQTPAQRRVAKISSEKNTQVNQPQRKQPPRRPMKPHFTQPNCLPLGKRKKQPRVIQPSKSAQNYKTAKPPRQSSKTAQPSGSVQPPSPDSNWSPTPNPRWNAQPSSSSKDWRNDSIQPNSWPKRNQPTVNYRQTRTYTAKNKTADLQQ